MWTSLGARTCSILLPIRMSLSSRGLKTRLLNKCRNIKEHQILPHSLLFIIVFLLSNLIEIKRIKWRSHTPCIRREDFQCLKRNVNEKTMRTTKLGCRIVTLQRKKRPLKAKTEFIVQIHIIEWPARMCVRDVPLAIAETEKNR